MKRKISVQEFAVQLLDSALVSHNLPDEEHDDLVLEVATVLKTRNASKVHMVEDGKCFICAEAPHERKYLTCLKCSRVYHMDCIRPKLTKEPKNGYICAFCAFENDNENLEAKKAMRLQLRLQAGLDSGNGEILERYAKGAELVITKSGKRFCAKKGGKRSNHRDSGCEGIDEALQALVSDPHYKGYKNENEEMCALAV